jgi:hypothetical protein
MNALALSDDQYGLLFDIRRSIRYHERRKSFFETLHRITSFLTILMAGSVLFDIGKHGRTDEWLLWLSAIAAIIAAADMVIGFARKAGDHGRLREQFADLEIDMITGKLDKDIWLEYEKRRLLIEKDEPAIYVVLDGLCRNELLIAEGHKAKAVEFFKCTCWQRWTSHLFRWENVLSAQ